ncbi:M3 family oligoendopeptidase [Anaerocolumna xylanovorans]|uniref:Oligoendopeptidase, M3 family n=1 Tax=Anaerocolumna xylanovorans DSM 12503 TaxID=1121345 RepID=A0A1M7Y1D6_9FIRM|nr:M3 family oligoendopeptidase [Anaerocolumna xylanovorans]SHO45606.1 oligoendopeptidase, M3 family [Anaerocolumna xylanovorans DSM 12503]
MENFTFPTLKYQRPDFVKYEEELKRMTETVKKAGDYQTIQAVLHDMDELDKPVSSMRTIAMIRNTLDTTDEFYEKEYEYVMNKSVEVETHKTALLKELLASRFAGDIENEYGSELLVSMQRNVDQFKEEIIPHLQQELALKQQYQKLMATAEISFNGEVLNLYGIQKYFEDPDRNTRKAAFKAYSDFYHKNEEEMENIFSELIEVRNEMGRALGYENFIPLAYIQQERSDYGVKEVASFREQVKREIVPLCEKLYEAQRKRIGVDELMVYDEEYKFTDGNAEPVGDDDYLVKQAQIMYHEMNPETSEFIDFMIEHELMDLKNKPHKASTGYMTILPSYKAPFVFSCFNHTIGDIQVLTHELGHAFAGYEAMREQKTSLFYMGGTDIAEIHSMTMEQFSYPYAENFFGDAADKFRFMHLQDAITFVPFGVAVDEFQHIVYANPDLTPKERTLEWHKLEEKYMPWRKYDNDEFMERGGYWYHKLHIFLYPFYYINYTLTTMGAMEFKKRYLENKDEAWKDYLNLCKAGSSRSYLELLKVANLSVPFEEGSVAKAISCAREILLKSIEEMES